MAMHATVEMLTTSLSQLTPKSVTSGALAIPVNSVAARGVFKYIIPEKIYLFRDCSWIKIGTILALIFAWNSFELQNQELYEVWSFQAIYIYLWQNSVMMFPYADFL